MLVAPASRHVMVTARKPTGINRPAGRTTSRASRDHTASFGTNLRRARRAQPTTREGDATVLSNPLRAGRLRGARLAANRLAAGTAGMAQRARTAGRARRVPMAGAGCMRARAAGVAAGRGGKRSARPTAGASGR
ncbi:MAG: hypothetical protein HY736_12220 [Verrucomicrobia bacterium]|nr:hypothetical protein [Verrucomicrobiota bacterium]